MRAARNKPGHPAGGGDGLIAALAGFCMRRARSLLMTYALVAVVAGALGAGAFSELSSGGYTATGTEAARAEKILADRFGASTSDLTVYAGAADGVDSPAAVAAGRRLEAWAHTQPGVRHTASYWDGGRPELRSVDGRAALIRLDLDGDDFTAMRTAERLSPGLRQHSGTLAVDLTGPAVVNAEATRQSQHDLLRAELIVLPLTVLILLLAFGSLAAALVPTAIAACVVTVAFAVLRLVNVFLPMSVFSLNIAAALGFGLAVDYALFVVTRFREELADGCAVPDAVVRSMRTAGRAAVYSAATVVAGLAVVLVLPLPFLRSLAIAGIVVVALGAAVSVTALPALLLLIGSRTASANQALSWRPVRKGISSGSEESHVWKAIAQVTVARPVVLLGLSVLVLLAMAVPFTQARFGVVDARVLPSDASARTAAEASSRAFVVDSERALTVVLPEADVTAPASLDSYARRLSRVPGVVVVSAVTGSYQAGHRTQASGTSQSRARATGPGTWVTVVGQAPAQSDAARQMLQRVRAVPAPGPRLVSGRTAQAADTAAVMGNRLPWAAALAALATAAVLLACTRSLLVPLKAVVVGVLSLTASLGALVWVFQQGHSRFLVGDVAVTGYLEVTMPVLVLALAFSASVDYELFLMTRIKEEYLATGDNKQAIVTGIARTGRLFSAAALIVAVAMGALATSGISMLKMLGIGLAIAVLVDATIVRGILVPAVMQLAGRANWWMPRLQRHPVHSPAPDGTDAHEAMTVSSSSQRATSP